MAEQEDDQRHAEVEDTMLLRRALSGEAARRSESRLDARCTIEVFDAGGTKTRECAVPDGGLSIGRSQDQDIRLNDRTVSRRHARIERVAGRYYLDDTGSLNDTLLDGEPVRGRAELYDGAMLTIGLHVLRVTLR